MTAAFGGRTPDYANLVTMVSSRDRKQLTIKQSTNPIQKESVLANVAEK